MVLKGLKDNKEYLKLREKELEEIKKVSGQVVTMTMSMSVDVEQHKKVLGKLISYDFYRVN